MHKIIIHPTQQRQTPQPTPPITRPSVRVKPELTIHKTITGSIKPIQTIIRPTTRVIYTGPDASPAPIKSIQGIGINKAIVIVGNGPSVLQIPLAETSGRPRIDVMSVNKPDARVWPSKYWTFFDQSQIRRHNDAIRAYTGTIFNTTSIKHDHKNTIKFKNIHRDGFSLDLTEGINLGRSSVFAGMQIALWMGYDKIYIIGCDMAAVDGKVHFYGVNPDVDEKVRISRFDNEALYYEEAANRLPEETRKRFVFCSDYNKYPFVDKFNRLSHTNCIENIISQYG